MQTYRVLRPHEGDKLYQAGDTREAVAAHVAHLVPDTLEPLDEASAPEPKKARRSKE